MTRILFTALLVLLPVSAASARCVCACMDGHVQQLCQNSYDIPAICSPRICPIAPPSIEPIQRPRIPSIGTTGCRMQQVWNGWRYDWVQVCT